jgi:tetratricopeptide (TPR) repeat protein
MGKLNQIRQQEEISKQQLAQAKQKFDEGLALFNQKKYPEAIAALQQSLVINPNSLEAGEYLRLAQEEQRKAEAARLARAARAATRTPAATATQPAETATQAAAEPAQPSQLTTVFTHPFTDGRIIVRAGGDVVANEPLFEDRPARLFRRASRAAKPVSVTHALPPKNADVQIWVTVPALGIQEHHVLEGVRFQPGGAHRLIVRYDAASKRFTYELN